MPWVYFLILDTRRLFLLWTPALCPSPVWELFSRLVSLWWSAYRQQTPGPEWQRGPRLRGGKAQHRVSGECRSLGPPLFPRQIPSAPVSRHRVKWAPSWWDERACSATILWTSPISLCFSASNTAFWWVWVSLSSLSSCDFSLLGSLCWVCRRKTPCRQRVGTLWTRRVELICLSYWAGGREAGSPLRQPVSDWVGRVLSRMGGPSRVRAPACVWRRPGVLTCQRNRAACPQMPRFPHWWCLKQTYSGSGQCKTDTLTVLCPPESRGKSPQWRVPSLHLQGRRHPLSPETGNPGPFRLCKQTVWLVANFPPQAQTPSSCQFFPHLLFLCSEGINAGAWPLLWVSYFMSSHAHKINFYFSYSSVLLSCFRPVWLFATPYTVAHQAFLSMRFPR